MTTFLLCQKPAYLVCPAVRLDDEVAAVEGRFRAADFNLCPVARKHDALRKSARIADHDFGLGNVDVFVLMPSLHIRVQGPAQQGDLRARERQHRPVTEHGRDACDAESTEANAAEEQQGTVRAQ